MEQPGFVGGTLDRADPVRTDPARMAAAFDDPRARRLILNGLDPMVRGDRLAQEPLPGDARLADHVLLGVGEEGPVFAWLNPDAPHAGGFAPRLWHVVEALAPDQLALYGTARSLIDWHRRHGFCAQCGARTQPDKGGWARRCDKEKGGCGAEHFPRVDPVTIMLAEHGGRILLGRQPRFPAGRYSALAGFVEPGETVEEAVARELYEEAGIRVKRVRYISSQPWPFPSSLMIACIADAVDDRLTIDHEELDDARWFDVAEVRAAMAEAPDASFVAPPARAVAHHLLRHWLDAQGDEA